MRVTAEEMIDFAVSSVKRVRLLVPSTELEMLTLLLLSLTLFKFN